MNRMFITSGEVAGLLELPSANAFLARRADLEEKGFPLPCSWSARPMRWRAELVRAWINTQGQPRALGHKPQLVTQDFYLQRAASA
jgi:hypothetical protein